MPNLTAANVTVAVQEVTVGVGAVKRRNRCKVTFGDGALTYPSGGVPLPAASAFGMPQALDYIVLIDSDDAQGIMWKYDFANKKLRGYIMGIDINAAGALVLDDFPLDTTGEPMATAISIGLAGAAAGINYLGRMQELLADTHAPAAHTMYVEAVGS